MSSTPGYINAYTHYQVYKACIIVLFIIYILYNAVIYRPFSSLTHLKTPLLGTYCTSWHLKIVLSIV